MTAVAERPHDRVLDVTAQHVRDVFEAAISASFVAENLDRAREPGLSMSGLGGCTRAAAYAIAGTPPSDEYRPEEARAATLGTWEHAGILPRLAAEFGGQDEVPVKLRAAGLVIPGTADLVAPLPRYLRRQPKGVAIGDEKTVGEHRLHGVRRHGPYADHRTQVWGYALGAYQNGHQVEWVVWLYMDRASGATETIAEPFTPARAMHVLDQARRIREYADADPELARREGRGPGLSFACDRCWWLTRCWGEEAQPGVVGAQSSLMRTDADVEAALLMYYDATKTIGAAKKDQEYAKALLSATPVGPWGPWEYGRTRDGEAFDQKEAKARLTAAGIEVPMMAKSGHITVKPVKAIKAAGAAPAAVLDGEEA